jgi:hypothetical protein
VPGRKRFLEDAMSIRRLCTAAAGLLLTMTPAWAKTARQTDWQTYQSSDYGFRIDYPQTMSFYPGGPVRPPEKSMFPICDEGTVACFEYDGHVFDRTQIQSMGVSVNLLRQYRTEADCDQIDTEAPILTTTINGTVFHYAQTGDGGLGSFRIESVYRTLHAGMCFEVALVTAQSDLSAQDLKMQGRKLASRRTRRKLAAQLKRMLDSFAFVGPVSDNAGWSLYTVPECGETFAYPDSATVETVVPAPSSSLAMLNTWDLACLQEFEYYGRRYAIAAKENLNGRDAIDAWLETSGLPQLDQMQVTAHGPGLTEYSSPDAVYFLHGTSLFLVALRDAFQNAKQVPLDRDGVVEHLVSSFRVR